MTTIKQETYIDKPQLLDQIKHGEGSGFKSYQEFFVGSTKITDLIKYELINMLFGGMPGALGLVTRKALFPSLFKKAHKSIVWGRNIALRNPKRISIGAGSAIDDNVLMDARGHEEGIELGENVIIARNALLQAKNGYIKIGNNSTISGQCIISSVGGIEMGDYVMVAGHCYIGGGRYKTDDLEKPIKYQQLFTLGTIVIEDNVWIGAGVKIQDGVRIGTGAVIGTGATIREDVPPNTIVAPHFRNVMLPRQKD